MYGGNSVCCFSHRLCFFKLGPNFVIWFLVPFLFSNHLAEEERCKLAVCVLFLFPTVPLIGLQSPVIVVFPGKTHVVRKYLLAIETASSVYEYMKENVVYVTLNIRRYVCLQ